jgi:uracil-DNA glycosylase family 4
MIGNKVIGYGPTPALIAIVGEGPGASEADQGLPFVGASGYELNNYLIRCAGIYRNEVFITNIVKWRTDEDDRNPTDQEIERDRPELYEELYRASPYIIVAVGKIAAQFFLGKSVKMEYIHGLPFDPIDPVAKELGCKILPVYHPAAGIRQPDRYGKLVWDDFRSLGKLLRGEIESTVPPDKYPTPLYTKESPQTLLTLDPTLPIALDTEGWVDDPYSIQVTQQVGKASVITEPTTYSSVFDGKMIVGHNMLHDLPIIRALGISTYKADIHDTMIGSYLLGLTPKALKPLSYRLNQMEMGSYPALIHSAEVSKVNQYLTTAWIQKVCRICEGKGNLPGLAKRKGKLADDKCSSCSGTGKIGKRGKKGQLLKTSDDCACVVLADVPLKSTVRCPACVDGANWPAPPVIYDEEGKLKRPWSISRRLKKMMEEITSIGSEDDEEGEDVDEDEASHPLRKRWYNIDPEIRRPVEDIIGKLPRTTLRDVKDTKAVIEYAGRDADATLRDFNVIMPMLKEQGLERVYDIDRGILPILDRMQSVGMLVDLDYFSGFQKELETELVVIQDRLSSLVGYNVNAGSPDQVSELLYGRLKLDPPKFSKKTEKPSTDAKSMESLKIKYAFDAAVAPIIDVILDYREHAKMLGTYVLPIQRLADKNCRIHTQLLYTNTASGRLASRNINLQNIPTRSPLGKRVRKGFIAPPGCVLVSVDLDQVELRVGAHLSRDENMIEIFRSGKDIHRATAALVYKLSMDLITSDQRVAAKTVNFGIFYGMQATRLMNELALLGIKITRQEAMDFIAAWFEAYPGVKCYMADVYAEARQTGMVRTMFGRIRYFPAVWSPLDGIREEALRQIGNQPVQGTAGDILKVGMKNVYDHSIPEVRQFGYCEPLVPVHDELIFEAEESIAPLLQCHVEYEMSHAANLLAPLGAKGNIAKTWGDLK